MGQMLNQAKKWGLVGTNIAEVVTCPKAEKKPYEILTQHQVNTFLFTLKDDPLFPFYVTILSTGIRRGEAIGLKWENVDLVEGVISIKGIITTIKGKTTWGEPKTASSRRIIALPEFTKTILIDHKLKQTVESEFVFCTSVGTPYSPSNILKHFKKMAKIAGLPPDTTIHSLRHFFTSYALSQNVPIKDVQAILGHTDAKFTLNVYAHLMEGAKAEAAKKMNKLFDTP